MSKNLTRRDFVASLAAVTAASSSSTLRAADPLQVGFVYVTPLAPTGWTAQHNEGRLHLERTLGARVKTRYVENVAEGADAERVIRDLAVQGCGLIVTTSFGYMEPTLKVARQFPKTVFEHISGYKSAANVGFANARFYEGRYLAGMVAGGVSRTGVVGYVAAFPIPEVVQGINAFVLGMRAVNPKAELKVVWVNSWYDPGRERDAALTLINQGADVLTNHTDSSATAVAAQEQQRWCVGYHSDLRALAGTAQLTAVTHHWGEFYVRSAQSVLAGAWKPSGLWGGLREGMVRLADFGAAVPEALRGRVRERQAAIAAGKFHPFSGRLLDNEGRVRQEAGSMADEALNRIDWYVQGVQGETAEGLMQGYRAALLRFLADDTLERIDDALVVVDQGRIADAGPFDAVAARFPQVGWHDWRGRVLAPGFIDVHVHFPQLDVIGSPAEGLLPWLENYTFPHEARFADPAYASAMAELFLDELLRNGVTTAMVYCSSHAASAEAFFEAAGKRSLRMVAGKCLMDRNSPESVRDDTRRGLVQSQFLIERWHGRDRLGYAITPRFAPSCSDEQMRGAAELADAFPGTWVQTHVAENRDEIAWVAQLFPDARSYLDVYDRLGLLRERSMYAHCIHLDAADRARLAATGASAAVCPTSNLFLGSGLFDFEAASQAGFSWGLASDVGGGTSFSPFRTMLAAYEVARLGGVTLSPQALWYRHTLGAARAMGLDGLVGNLSPGHEADFIALDARATTLLARRTGGAWSLDEWLFAMIVLGDDRAIADAVVAGVPVPRPGLPVAQVSPSLR